jgi:sugar phosphate isomerase/epimerase
VAKFILSSFADEAGSELWEQLRISEKNNIKYIEMRGLNGRGIVDYSIHEAKEVANELKSKGFKLSAIGSPFGKINIKDDFKPHLERFKRTVELAHILEAPNIRLFSFFIPKDEEPSFYRDEVMERLEAFLDACSDGVACLHENEKGIYGDNDVRCLDILSTFKGRMKGIFDPANFIQCKVEILPTYELLEPFIDYLHIKDAVLSTGKVVPSGRGDGHLAEVIDRFAKKSGTKFLSVEPHLKVFDGLKLLRDDVSVMTEDYTYKTSEDAYDAAVDALKELLKSINYKEIVEGNGPLWIR